MNTTINDFFANNDELNSFKRIDNQHILDFYLGANATGQYTLLLISDKQPVQLKSSQIINIHSAKRKDKRWAIAFCLLDDSFKDIFCRFCEDMIESSRTVVDKVAGTNFVCERYVQWQKMLKRKPDGLLDFSEIKGLIGEIYFLQNELFARYGITVALQSWLGPDKADQDFICPDKWYEVKTTVSGAEVVKISSVEQLDNEEPGELVVVFLDKTSETNPQRITLNSIIASVEKQLLNNTQKELFSKLLLIQGYFYRPEYDQYSFRYSGCNRYKIDMLFPCLRRNNIPRTVENAVYTVSLASINEYKI